MDASWEASWLGARPNGGISPRILALAAGRAPSSARRHFPTTMGQANRGDDSYRYGPGRVAEFAARRAGRVCNILFVLFFMIAQFEKVICNNHTKHFVITILAGGTGSVKIVRGLAAHDSDINVITNVGDNYWLYGMYVCPDIDTIVYGLADLLDVERGWGVKKDTFNFLRQMEVFGEETWFRIGDRDAATHLMRTNKLKNGENLSNITKWLCEQFAVSANIIPVSDNNIETRITTNKGDLHLQEYWVKYRGREDVLGIQYVGADKARANPEAVSAIQNADTVVISPGNPLTSIGPMLQIKGIKKELSRKKSRVVAISPLIGDDAISGPAGKYMRAAGIESNAYGLAKMYTEVCSNIIIDTKDKKLAKKIQGLDYNVMETKITMRNKQAEETLAAFVLKNLRTL